MANPRETEGSFAKWDEPRKTSQSRSSYSKGLQSIRDLREMGISPWGEHRAKRTNRRGQSPNSS